MAWPLRILPTSLLSHPSHALQWTYEATAFLAVSHPRHRDVPHSAGDASPTSQHHLFVNGDASGAERATDGPEPVEVNCEGSTAGPVGVAPVDAAGATQTKEHAGDADEVPASVQDGGEDEGDEGCASALSLRQMQRLPRTCGCERGMPCVSADTVRQLLASSRGSV